jgi:GTP-binding protein EngB required for normal cell division
MSSIPIFAVVGDPNAGKSTLVATLAEDDTVEISRRAGTTKRATHYEAKSEDLPILDFIDLPGFENTADLREWLENNKERPGNLAAEFVTEHQGQQQFSAECEILRSLDGVAVLYVVDASRPLQRRDRDQAEILRLITDKRLAIINVQDGQSDDQNSRRLLEDWRQMLGQHFTCQDFNPHRANFAARMELLEKISHVMPGWREPMRVAIQKFREDWSRRLDSATDAFLSMIEEVISITVHVPIANDNNADRASEQAREEVKNRIRDIEERFRKEIRSLFLHRSDNWEISTGQILAEDLFNERVWKFLGLDKKTLILTGVAVGAAVGFGLDLLFAGFTFGIFTASGAVLGGVGAWFTAGQAIDIKMPGVKIPGIGLRVPMGRLRSNTDVVAEVKLESNVLWILMDRALQYLEAAAAWSHGRREAPAPLIIEKVGPTSTWDAADRKNLVDWIGVLKAAKIGERKLGKEKMNRDKAVHIDQAARNFVRAQIERMSGS